VVIIEGYSVVAHNCEGIAHVQDVI